jgi:hypothetical protein
VRVRRCEAVTNEAVADPSPATTQVAAAPLHAPVQPLKSAPADGVAVSVTEAWNFPAQLPGQSIPEGVLVTLPGPLTMTETECSDAR